MIFICDNQFSLPTSTTDKALKAFTYKELGIIYKDLYALPENIFKDVETIVLFIQANLKDEQALLNIIKHYSADENDYPEDVELMNEICHVFPTSDERSDPKKRVKTEKLIKELSIISFENSKKVKKAVDSLAQDSKLFLFNCSHIKNNSLALIEKLADDQVLIQGDSLAAKLNEEICYYTISRQKYLQINKELVSARQNHDELKIERRKTRDYRPGDPLEYFPNSLFDKLVSLIKTQNKKVHFYGQDTLLSNRAIEKLIPGEDRISYNMPKDLSIVPLEENDTIIKNFDNISDTSGYYDLHQRVKGLENKFYVILQAIRNVDSQDFYYYEKVEIPRSNEIRKHITGIFLSLLVDRYKYKEEQSELYTLVKFNLLEKVIPQVENLETLYKCIKEISELTIKDLLTNINFWYVLEEKVNEEFIKSQRQSESKPKKKIIFESSEKEWILFGLGNPLQFDYAKSIGIKYIAIIISYYQLYGKPIDVSKLRDMAHDLDDSTPLKYQYNQCSDNDRVAIHNNIKRIQTKQAMENFCKNHIKKSKTDYWFDSKNEVECEVIHPKINEDFLSKYTK
jgi:hypothetical protein